MKTLAAFFKKEWMAQLRTGRVWILAGIFALFGVMNPAIAKLTPWLMEMLSDTLEGSGLAITSVTVSALDSWMQFFKNIPMALIAFVLLEGGIFTREYRTGTLILALTKGLERYKVVVAKAVTLIAVWTAGYWLCFGITYGGNTLFWDNGVARNLMFSGVCWWAFGLWVVALMVLFSVVGRGNTLVLLGTGGTVLGATVIGLIPKIKAYIPTCLMEGNPLIYGVEESRAYIPALVIAGVLCVLCMGVSIPVFNKKQL